MPARHEAPTRHFKRRSEMALVQESEIDRLIEHLRGTAEWRHMKAEEFPDDDRNPKAAALLEKLAEQMEALSRSELDRRLASLWLGRE
jgi:hypothetical protein